MFFENNVVSFNILDVLYIDQKNVSIYNSGRNFNALSLRISADSILRTDKNEYHLKDNVVSFVPARLDYTRISQRDELIVIHFETTNYNMKNIECFETGSPKILEKLFRDILELWRRKEIGYEFRCTAIMYEILAECYVQNYSVDKKCSKIKASVDYIKSNYKKSDLTIKEVAERSFMSEVYFRKLFKEEFEMSPQKYIIGLRIQNAEGLISTGYYTLKEVAYLSGYNDYKYFSVEFKKMLGVSPSEYLYNYEER